MYPHNAYPVWPVELGRVNHPPYLAVRNLRSLSRVVRNYKYVNRESIVQLVDDFGLKHDNRGLEVYGASRSRMRLDNFGLWQIPGQIVPLCEELGKYDLNSFLEIGTHTGYSFLLLRTILQSHNPELSSMTIDPYIWISDSFVRTFNIDYRCCSSEKLNGNCYDVVMIDGDHDFDGVNQDFENVGQYAKVVIFHDIADKFVKHECQGGGVPSFWAHIKTMYKHIEFVTGDSMGIGLLFVGIDPS